VFHDSKRRRILAAAVDVCCFFSHEISLYNNLWESGFHAPTLKKLGEAFWQKSKPTKRVKLSRWP
jgi:hypothetical protein